MSDFESTVTLLPRRVDFLVNDDLRTLDFDYRPQYADEGKTLERVVVVVADVTEKLRLERDAAIQAERVRKISKAASNLDNFSEFLREVIILFKRTESEFSKSQDMRDMRQLKRDLHTIKGTVGTFEFSSLATDVHELESFLEDPPEVDPQKTILSKWEYIKDKWKFETTDIDQVLGLDQMRSKTIVSTTAFKRIVDDASKSGESKIVGALTQLRCFPIAEVFAHYKDYVSKLCERRGNKRISFEFKSDSHDLAFEEIQRIDGILIHIFRNCLDHGIEEMEVRKVAGKNETGVLNICAFRTAKGFLHLVIKDDGGGVDGDKLAKKAVEHGFWSPEQFAKSSPQERIELMFAPSLSTADTVSDTSGRGVGMDAVKSMLQDLKGSISVFSQKGIGTQFEIDVPMMEPWSRLIERQA